MQPEKILWTQSDKDFFAIKRKEKPAVDQLFKDIRSLMEQFPGSTITYLKIEEREWGAPSPEGVVPNVLASPQTIPKAKEPQLLGASKNAKRRALMKYKE